MFMTDEIEKSNLRARIVRCPTCHGDSPFDSSNVSRPFCSMRCKNMDLGAWANEEFRVDSKQTNDDGALDTAFSASDGEHPKLI
jgi:endogenous inhibitor of DNA gyrase (YacG/DUF329 family)